MRTSTTLLLIALLLSNCHGTVHAQAAGAGAAPKPNGDDDSTSLQIFINNGGGDLGGNTYTYSRTLTGPIKLSHGTLKYIGPNEPAQLDSHSDLERLTISGGTHVRFSDNSTGITIRGCDVTAVNATGLVSNLTLVGNFFPGSTTEFDAIFLNDVGNNVVITDNTFGPIHEPIHIIGGLARGFVCSYNKIVGAQRHGIELQFQAQGAVIQGNLLEDWRKNPGDDGKSPQPNDSHIAISAALGPSENPTTPTTVYSNNTLIDGNVINFNGQTDQPLTCGWSQNQGIEFMGNHGTVSNNWVRNAGFNAYTWADGFVSKNNVWIGYGFKNIWNGEPGGPSVAPTVIGDRSFALGATDVPPPPKAGPRPNK
ncbi:MAG TPA: hypothetical protein VHY37_08275 [Tepidisphaeraceae bacterium]|nr:hypothetical protein [Tepidisphaeraceae bacterium]